MVELFLGFCIGVISMMVASMIVGYRISKKEDELNEQLIKEFQDKLFETQDRQDYKSKRYEG